jgi:hypothetical protein
MSAVAARRLRAWHWNLSGEPVRSSVGRHVEQFAGRPLHRLRVRAPCIQEAARIFDGSTPCLFGSIRKAAGIGAEPRHIGRQRGPLFDCGGVPGLAVESESVPSVLSVPPRAVAMPRGFRDAAFSRKASRQRLEPRGGPAMTVAECPRGQGRDLRRGERGWPGRSADERRWRDQGNVGPAAYTAKKMTLRFWRRVARQPLCPHKGWVL